MGRNAPDFDSTSSLPSTDIDIDTVFTVNWLELEILKILNKSVDPIYKGELIHTLRSKHRSLDKKPDSSFYAIFDKLEKIEFIKYGKIKGMGYRTYLELTEFGKIELFKSLNWAIQTIAEGMRDRIIDVFQSVCAKNFQCHKTHNYGIVSLSNPDFLIPEVCNHCVDVDGDTSGRRYNILMPYSSDIKIDFFQSIRATPDDVPLKDELLDRFTSVLSLGLIEEKQINGFIQEMHRLLKPGGKAVFFEIRKFESYLFEALESITGGFSVFFEKKHSHRLKQFNDNELIQLIEAVFGKNTTTLIDLREFMMVIASKE